MTSSLTNISVYHSVMTLAGIHITSPGGTLTHTGHCCHHWNLILLGRYMRKKNTTLHNIGTESFWLKTLFFSVITSFFNINPALIRIRNVLGLRVDARISCAGAFFAQGVCAWSRRLEEPRVASRLRKRRESAQTPRRRRRLPNCQIVNFHAASELANGLFPDTMTPATFYYFVLGVCPD